MEGPGHRNDPQTHRYPLVQCLTWNVLGCFERALEHSGTPNVLIFWFSLDVKQGDIFMTLRRGNKRSRKAVGIYQNNTVPKCTMFYDLLAGCGVLQWKKRGGINHRAINSDARNVGPPNASLFLLI